MSHQLSARRVIVFTGCHVGRTHVNARNGAGGGMAFFGLFGRSRYERIGFMLYHAAVSAARDPLFYTNLGVPDTLDGRFDMVALHVCVLIRRLRSLPAPGATIAQAIFDAMFSDMDISLRELGVGDMTVARNVRAMWEAFHGRAMAYEAAIADADPEALPLALRRNVWRGENASYAADLAQVTRHLIQNLDTVPAKDLFAGRVSFGVPSVTPAVAA